MPMASVGIRTVSFGGRMLSICGKVPGDISRHLRRAMVFPGDHHSGRLRSLKMCLDNLGEFRGGATTDCRLQLAQTEAKSRSRQQEPTVPLQLDQLMKESVTEIVKNIKEAPFLVQVFSKEMGEDKILTSPTGSLKLVIDKATSESWPFITQGWEDGYSTPDGVILVEELTNTDAALITGKGPSDSACAGNGGDSTSASAKVWGLLVQGRGVIYPACYILKTCQVKCCFGLSTHFCLAKVDCFGQDIDFHLKKMWLQR